MALAADCILLSRSLARPIAAYEKSDVSRLLIRVDSQYNHSRMQKSNTILVKQRAGIDTYSCIDSRIGVPEVITTPLERIAVLNILDDRVADMADREDNRSRGCGSD